ncbi:AMP-binding protein [Streptomyces sp. ME19-01-6]|uniref:AMP-binding protein n=1 Tax=Streptomyces sp. ME19-01-6 TaxID=3028686 RepID=UPI0029B9A90D|nr:AMP-binding protein [Streptomyces sp. ME19-01-6]MDX3227937.1 AMP-binding protein [Streptomyces sp. ME19-01-6]
MLSNTRGFTFVSGESAEFLSFADLKEAAENIGRRIAAAGFTPGDRAILMLSDQREFITAFMGMVRAGVTPVPVFPPALPTRTEAYRERLTALHASCLPRRVIADERLFDLCAECVGERPLLYAQLSAGEATGRLVEPSGNSPLFLPYTPEISTLPTPPYEFSRRFAPAAFPEPAVTPSYGLAPHRAKESPDDDLPKSGNAQDAPIGIAADWLTGVWQQCAVRSPAVSRTPDGK